MRTAERNRLVTAPQATQTSIQQHLEWLDAEIRRLEAEIQAWIDQSDEFKEQQDLLTSVPGIGNMTAFYLVASLSHWERRNAKQIASFVGTSHPIPTRVAKERKNGAPGAAGMKCATCSTWLPWPRFASTRCPGLLPALAKGRQALQGRPGGCHAQVADHRARYLETPTTLELCPSHQPLTKNTVTSCGYYRRLSHPDSRINFSGRSEGLRNSQTLTPTDC